MTDERIASIFAGVGPILDDLEGLYKDVHRHPELSMQEERTAGLAAERLADGRLRGDDRSREDGRRRACSETATGRR